MTFTTRHDALKVPAEFSPASDLSPELVIFSYDDNLVFEHENLAQTWVALQEALPSPFLPSNDNARRTMGIVAAQAMSRYFN